MDKFNSSNSGLPYDNVDENLIIEGNDIKWIGSGGLTKFDGINWSVYNTSNSGLPFNTFESIVIDKQGNKWIGSNGLVKFDGTNWEVYNTSNSGIPTNYIGFAEKVINNWLLITCNRFFIVKCKESIIFAS